MEGQKKIMKSVSAGFGEGDYAVSGRAVLCGEDINFSFTGGTQPHIGAVSIAVYEPVRDSATVSTIAVYEHRDDQLAARCAKDAATVLKCTVVVSVGIHIDNAAPEDIQIFKDHFDACYRLLLEQIRRTRKRDVDEEDPEDKRYKENSSVVVSEEHDVR